MWVDFGQMEAGPNRVQGWRQIGGQMGGQGQS